MCHGSPARSAGRAEAVQQDQMIDKLSAGIAKWLLHAGAISPDEQELYRYATYSLLFSLIPVGIVIILGSSFGMMVEGIFLILPFMLIRKYSGGFHLKSPRVCFVISVTLLTVFLLGIRYILSTGTTSMFFHLSVFLASTQLFIASPIDSEVRQLTEKEHTVFRKIARILVCSIFCLYLIISLAGVHRFVAPIGGGIMLTALLQLPCFFLSSKNMQSRE